MYIERGVRSLPWASFGVLLRICIFKIFKVITSEVYAPFLPMRNTYPATSIEN